MDYVITPFSNDEKINKDNFNARVDEINTKLGAGIQHAEDAAQLAVEKAQGVQTAIDNANSAAAEAKLAANDVNTSKEAADTAASAANLEAQAAKEVRTDMEKKLATGYFKGDKGDKGDRGDSGVLTSVDLGMFAMYVNGAGHLIVKHNDGTTPPPLSIKDGHLIYDI